MTTDVLLERPHGSKASRSVRGFWVGSVTVLGLLLVAGDSRYWNDYFAFALVFLSAVFPAFLWMSGRAAGLPLFPVFAASTILPFAFPLISQSAPLGRFDSGERILAAVKIATALALGSWVWYAMLRRLRKNNPQVRVIDERRADRLFIGAIAMSAFFATAINGGWLQPYWGATTIVRGILLALNSIGSFVIGFRWGTRALERTYRLVFVIAFLFYLLATISSLLLIGAMTACALFVTGFSIGRRRIPWRWIAAGLVVFGVLHIGKTRMRDRYWFGREDAAAVAPCDYG